MVLNEISSSSENDDSDSSDAEESGRWGLATSSWRAPLITRLDEEGDAAPGLEPEICGEVQVVVVEWSAAGVNSGSETAVAGGDEEASDETDGLLKAEGSFSSDFMTSVSVWQPVETRRGPASGLE